MIINWHGKATSAGQVFCKRRFAPQSSPFWSHLSRLCKMQVLNKGLDMRYHAFFLRLTIAEFQILNTKKSETSEHQHGAYTFGHGRLYLKLRAYHSLAISFGETSFALQERGQSP